MGSAELVVTWWMSPMRCASLALMVEAVRRRWRACASPTVFAKDVTAG